jgi:hypothetical protein
LLDDGKFNYQENPAIKRSQSEIQSNEAKRRCLKPIDESSGPNPSLLTPPLSEDPSTSTGRPLRQRCDNCHDRRVKCDRKDPSKPCERCIVDKRDCVISFEDTRGPKKGKRKKEKNQYDELEERLAALELKFENEKMRRIEAEVHIVAKLEKYFENISDNLSTQLENIFSSCAPKTD